MTVRLSKFVGRDQLPGDEAAFDRITRAFAAASVRGPAATKKVAKHRRIRKFSVALAAPARKAA